MADAFQAQLEQIANTPPAETSPPAGEGPTPGAAPPPALPPCRAGWRYVSADTAVARGPVDYWGAILTGDGGGVADVTLYDGANASGRQVLTLWASTVESRIALLPIPITLEDGLFVDVGSNVTGVFVLYVPRRE